MFISGDGQKAWYSALELEQIAHRYAEEKSIEYDFSQANCTVWVQTDGGRVLANVDFSSGMGKPFLRVVIDRFGSVIRHETGTSVCGVSSE